MSSSVRDTFINVESLKFTDSSKAISIPTPIWDANGAVPNVLNEDDIFLDDESPLGLKAKLGNRPMAIFHGSWEEVMYYIENPYEEAFDASKIKLPVLS